AGGVDVLEDGNCYIMHHKVIIIDDRIVITGSYNFTASAETSNDESLLIIDDPTLAAAYVAEFDRLYAQATNPTRCG
ncbi:MAG TPA: phospholipase D-like domain-containing protein, partial [Roseiflexaceae bacterium]|nr:phospholipase D-like domain-containing protein [Roseiflexaceae bacterium]